MAQTASVIRPIVGLIGKKRVGKDSFARRLTEGHGYRRHAFADRLREMLLRLNPIVDGDFWQHTLIHLSKVVREEGWEAAKEIPEVRRLMQECGQRVREIDPGFWIRPVFADVVAHSEPVVITDVRYRNEAEAVLKYGGLLVRILKPTVDDGDAHDSETELADYPTQFEVVNEASIEHLWEMVDELAPIFARRPLERVREQLAVYAVAHDNANGVRGNFSNGGSR